MLLIGSHVQTFYVTPRNISPWSSKATSIAAVCGLKDSVERIERGRRITITFSEPVDATTFKDALHDRMTETFSTQEPDLSKMFQVGQPYPLEVVDLSGGSTGTSPIDVLKAYNKERGLALDIPEMEYLVEAYKKVGRVS